MRKWLVEFPGVQRRRNGFLLLLLLLLIGILIPYLIILGLHGFERFPFFLRAFEKKRIEVLGISELNERERLVGLRCDLSADGEERVEFPE
ncbi:hypothetical protein OIU74_009211 [Salix koriyanagi]|uniref:Uncharacterized protein n=1 Tax=Salix koriyanagi TaxID=2511006 RepID=A0A9Q0TRU3_9ROSI|nr:hypothetical protein OIU74_009211 [Salix koriyanagi]